MSKAFRSLKSGVLVIGLGCAFISACNGGDGPPEEPQRASVADERGRQLYLSNGCVVCHGEQGHGDGRIAQTLKPPPRDFRDLSHYKRGPEVEQIAETIAKGIAGTSMPGFSHLTGTDRLHIARHIVFLQQQP